MWFCLTDRGPEHCLLQIITRLGSTHCKHDLQLGDGSIFELAVGLSGSQH
jgi:hypothetical protein